MASSDERSPGTPSRYNTSSASVRRLMRECKEMEADPSTLYRAAPLEDNLFEWHFTIRGPKDTEFEGGVYHGRILFPSDYPYRPPDIVFLTKNGRFELEKKICLTISSHHEETWRPSWSIRTVLVALIAFMPTKGDGAIASLDWTPEERKRLALQSIAFKCDRCGSHNSTALRPEDVNETLNPDDVPEELQIRDSSKKPTATASSSSSDADMATSSNSSIPASPPPADSNNGYDQPPSTGTPVSTHRRAAVVDRGDAPAYEENPLPHNPPNEPVFNQPQQQQHQAQTEHQIRHTMREYMDIMLSAVVLLIGLLVIRKLFIYL